MKLSIVIPVYYNELNINPLYDDIKQKLIDKIDFEYEIVMVDDGSGDNSWSVMKDLAARDKHIKIYHLARNFGSYAASLCGLSHCTGDCAVVKAADLQEPTEMIHQMIKRWREGYNVVLAVRTDRDEPWHQKLFASMYYKLTQKFVLSNMPDGGFDTYLLDRQVIKTLQEFDEKDSALTGQILWSGFKTTTVPYIRKAREIGKSRWTIKKKVKLVMDTLYGFSAVPITIVSLIGMVSVAGALLWGISVFIGKMLGRINVDGWTTLFIFNLLSFGVIMLTLGILGGYLWRTFNATRKRPVYIIEEMKERTGLENEDNAE